MLRWEGIVQDYIVRHSDQIQRTTRVLRNHFKINYFTYHRIDHLGNYTVLVDRPDWAEQYVNEKIFEMDPYLRHPSIYRSGVTLWENFGSKEYQNAVAKTTKEKFKADTSVLYIEKSETCVEFYGFSGNRESSLKNLTINHSPALLQFASYFKKEMSKVLWQMGEETIPLKLLKGNDFDNKEPIHPTISPAALLAYYKEIGNSSGIDKGQKLTSRERQCLRLLLEGKSAKETATQLALSHRTIEYYFENIKNKFGSCSKQEVWQIAEKLREIGLL